MNNSQLRHRPFLIINAMFRPKQNVKTERSGWKTPDAMQIFEQPYIVDKISDKIMSGASVIIDIENNKVIKSRFPNLPDEEIRDHYLEKYSSMVSEGKSVWALRRKIYDITP